MLVVTGYLHRCRLNLRNSCENCSYFCLPRNRFVFLRQRKIPSNQEYSRTEWHRTSITSVSLGWMIMRFILPQNCMERQTMSSTGITSEPEEYSASVYLRELQSFSLDKLDNLQDDQVVRIKPCDLKVRQTRTNQQRKKNHLKFILHKTSQTN